MSERICITGIGAATPLGNTYDAIAQNLLAGKSAIRKVTRFPVDDHPAQIAGLVDDPPCPAPLSPAEFDALERLDRLGIWCAVTALQDAGLWQSRSNSRVGVVLGTAAEWTSPWELDGLAGGKRVYEPHLGAPPLSERLQRCLSLAGPAVNISAACASGNYTLALARRWLESGWVDLCIAGGLDLALTPMTLAGFANLRALSRHNDHPAAASRPFDVGRDGFVMSEGGALFVLEKESSARRRSARIHGIVAGNGASSDAFHMVIPCSDPVPVAAAVRQALADAQVNADEVDYINAHATSTPVGDIAEAKALGLVFGPAIDKVPVSSTKSMSGHLLTGAASFEALACLIAMDRGVIPPTINLEQPDPECRLCHVANQAQERPVRVAMSNSFGFGGSNTCLVLRAA